MFFKARKKIKIFAPQCGECVETGVVPDPVFSEGLLGEGVCIIPEEKEVLSPVDGVVVQVFDTNHAYAIRSDEGLEILVHIGINTVELLGEGFSPKVKAGDRVLKGELLCLCDIDLLKERGYEIYTPVIVTNSDMAESVEILKGKTVGGETPIMEIVKKR